MKNFLLVVACLSAQELMDARCDTSCLREGYSGGVYISPDKCRCFDEYSTERLLGKRLTLPKKGQRKVLKEPFD